MHPQHHALVAPHRHRDLSAAAEHGGGVGGLLLIGHERSEGAHQVGDAHADRGPSLDEEGTYHHLRRRAQREVGVTQRGVAIDPLGAGAVVVVELDALGDAGVPQVGLPAEAQRAQVQGIGPELQLGPVAHRLDHPPTVADEHAEPRHGGHPEDHPAIAGEHGIAPCRLAPRGEGEEAGSQGPGDHRPTVAAARGG